MKVSTLIAKLQQFHPDSDLTEIDVWRLFDDDTIPREIDAKFERVQAYLTRGDLDGLREFMNEEAAQLDPINNTPGTDSRIVCNKTQ